MPKYSLTPPPPKHTTFWSICFWSCTNQPQNVQIRVFDSGEKHYVPLLKCLILAIPICTCNQQTETTGSRIETTKIYIKRNRLNISGK